MRRKSSPIPFPAYFSGTTNILTQSGWRRVLPSGEHAGRPRSLFIGGHAGIAPARSHITYLLNILLSLFLIRPLGESEPFCREFEALSRRKCWFYRHFRHFFRGKWTNLPRIYGTFPRNSEKIGWKADEGRMMDEWRTEEDEWRQIYGRYMTQLNFLIG